MMPPLEIDKIRGMLAYRRPTASSTEKEFIERYIDTVPGMYADGYGNRLLVCADSNVLISCHTDTVHRFSGKQHVKISRGGIVSLDDHTSNCLGADDTAGIYAALRMIEAGVKATFIFHREEEIGGRGSSWLAENYAGWLRTFKLCLALDRRGTQDVIVTQQWDTCASNDFARSLASELDMGHLPADGIFTDSANYTRLIPECSNISIGYRNEHSANETLDLNYLEAVIRRMIKVDWASLTIKRDPLEIKRDRWYGHDYYGHTSTTVSAGNSITLGWDEQHDESLICDGDVIELQVPEECALCGLLTDIIMGLEEMWVCQRCYDDELAYQVLAEREDREEAMELILSQFDDDRYAG